MGLIALKHNGVSTFNNGKEIIFSFTLTATGTPTFSGILRTLVGQNVEVFWGDGTSNTYTGATDQAFSHVYAAGTFVVNFVAVNKTILTRFTTAASAGTSIAFNLKVLPIGITYLAIGGANTVSGNISFLSRAMTYFVIEGSNTITGDIKDIPKSILTFVCAGSNTLYGVMSNIASTITYLYILGLNTISGSLSDAPLVCLYFYCTGSNIISTYTYPRTWSSTMSRVSLNGSTNLTPALNDQVLIDLNNVTTWTAPKTIYLKGTRTTASDAAVTALTAKGVAVTPLLAS